MTVEQKPQRSDDLWTAAALGVIWALALDVVVIEWAIAAAIVVGVIK